MHSALLYLRSLPLAKGDTKTFLVMVSSTPYLVTVKVTGRERVKTRAGEYPAIVCSLSLEKVNKTRPARSAQEFQERAGVDF